jgi:glycosyltransferase involved in cell wall biosynthesis
MNEPSLSVAIMAYNEEESIERVVREVREQLHGLDYEIIIVNDGSQDRTPAIADNLAAQHPEHTHVIHHPSNGGGGMATRSGLAAATKDLVMVIPGDGQFVVEDIPRFLEAIRDVDFVLSCRRNRAGGLMRRFNSALYRRVVRTILRLHYRQINWVKLYRRAMVQSLELTANSWLVDTEILYWASRSGWTGAEIEVEERPRLGGRATGSNPRFMLATAIELWKFRRSLRRRQPAMAVKTQD